MKLGRVFGAVNMQFRLVDQQASLYIVQTLAVGQLCEVHGTEFLRTTQIAYSDIAAIALYNACKTSPENELHNLCEQPSCPSS